MYKFDILLYTACVFKLILVGICMISYRLTLAIWIVQGVKLWVPAAGQAAWFGRSFLKFGMQHHCHWTRTGYDRSLKIKPWRCDAVLLWISVISTIDLGFLTYCWSVKGDSMCDSMGCSNYAAFRVVCTSHCKTLGPPAGVQAQFSKSRQACYLAENGRKWLFPNVFKHVVFILWTLPVVFNYWAYWETGKDSGWTLQWCFISVQDYWQASGVWRINVATWAQRFWQKSPLDAMFKQSTASEFHDCWGEVPQSSTGMAIESLLQTGGPDNLLASTFKRTW